MGVMSNLLEIYYDVLPILRRKIAAMFANPDDVEDVLQETFERIYRREKTQKNKPKITSYRTYLYNTARNIALNELNRKARKVTSYLNELSLEEPVDPAAEVEAQVMSRLKLAAFQEAINSLPNQCRRVFPLNKLYGLKQREIAQYLGISLGTVERHLAKGMLRCRRYMDAQGYSTQETEPVEPVQNVSKLYHD